MKQINLFFILFWIKRNWQVIVITLLLLVLLFQCESNKQPSLANDNKVNAENKLQLARQYQKQINKLVADYDATINALNRRNNEVENDLDKLRQKQKAKLIVVKHYNTNDIAKYYIELYNAPKGVKTVLGGVELKDTVSRLVINDLILGQGYKFESKFLKAKLSIANEKFNVANKTIDTLKINISSISTAYEDANKSKDLAIKDIEKQVKKERRKKNLYKITTVAAIIGGGYLLTK
jgi:hypothetical protein